ncbi:MAG: type II toxin-antitoxin system RelE/ParE family toxin [Dermatophilaceae bacterium]
MELRYATRHLERVCTDGRRMQRDYGAQVAKALRLRITELTRVEEMADLLLGTGRWEQLTADRAGQWSARLTGNWRLIVEPETDDATVVVLVVEIVDYHQ